MNSNDRSLLEAVCRGKLSDAQKIAKQILEADKTEKNRRFCESMLNQLKVASAKFIELPANLSGILMAEDVSLSFQEERNNLGPREEHIFGEIEKMHRAAGILAGLGVHYLNAVLLYGASGNGKTTFGRYVAYKFGLPFVYLNMSGVTSSYLGETSKNITRAFEYISNHPCVFMLDELDAIGSKRGLQNDMKEMSRVVINLLQNIDNVKNDVTLLAGTNRLEDLDEALVRRFPIRHEVKRFNHEERFIMAAKFLDDIHFDFDPVWLRTFTEPEVAQADMMNRLIQAIADRLVQEDGTGKEEGEDNGKI